MTTWNRPPPDFADDSEQTARTIDPRTAHVGFVYGDLSGGAEMCFGRLYFWRDANSNAAVWDWDLREQHPGVSDDEWQKLFCEAFDRGETAFVAKRIKENPKLLESEEGRLGLALGRLFGPRPPRPDQRGGEPWES